MEQKVNTAPVRAPLIKNLDFKVGLLLSFTAFLAIALVVNSLYARGVFDQTQRLFLVSDSADGISIGMKMSFAGFPIGQVERIDITDEGKARIELAIPQKNTRWLRTTSVFTLEKSMVGSAKIRAFSTNLEDPELVDGAERMLFSGDAMEQILSKINAVLDNIAQMSRADSSINASLANVEHITQRMAGDYGVLGGLLGKPEHSAEVVSAIKNANVAMKNIGGVSLKLDGMMGKADTQIFGKEGVMPEVQKAVVQVNARLEELRTSLQSIDKILKETEGTAANAKAISADVKNATTDLATLRTEVDDSLRKVNHLINEINRKWPFSRDVEIKLP